MNWKWRAKCRTRFNLQFCSGFWMEGLMETRQATDCWLSGWNPNRASREWRNCCSPLGYIVDNQGTVCFPVRTIDFSPKRPDAHWTPRRPLGNWADFLLKFQSTERLVYWPQASSITIVWISTARVNETERVLTTQHYSIPQATSH